MKRAIGFVVIVALMPFISLAQPDAPPPPAVVGISKPATVKIPGLGELAVAGPFVRNNLTFFVFYDLAQPGEEPDYITLAEGTKAGLVKITEDKNAQVRRLLISNLSDKLLFIQVGEIVKGGKQDRTMQTSLVVPPKTDDMPVQSFCVEQSRWSGGKVFEAGGIIIPDKNMKVAVQTGSQRHIWSGVAEYKTRAAGNVSHVSGKEAKPSRSSSVNEELADEDFRKLIGGYEEAMVDVTTGFKTSRGLATVVDGQISTVDIYHSSSLFRKLYPTLLKSAAAEAAAGQFKKIPSPVTVKQVVDFLAGAWDGKEQKESLGCENVVVRITTPQTLASQLFFKDGLIHVQVLKLDKPIILPANNNDRLNGNAHPAPVQQRGAGFNQKPVVPE